MSSTSPTPPAESRLARLFLAVAATATAGLAVCAIGWYRAATTEPEIEELSSEERQGLVEEMLDATPGVYRWTYFEPRIGYSLRPNAEVRAWGDKFRTNEYGYRTGPAAKEPGTFRVLFVGDSWTFGMGVRREQTFAEDFARLAEQQTHKKVEAWILALPGYNTMNELAALWFYFDRLAPDAVVLSLVQNDNHSSFKVLPNGSTTTRGVELDEFGDPHHATYMDWLVDSYRYQERWRVCYQEIRTTEERLARLRVPFLVAFVARFRTEEAHARMTMAGLRSPYVVIPIKLTQGKWKAHKYGHATPAAYALYSRIFYRGVAKLAGWPQLPVSEPLVDREPVFERPPPGTDWVALYRQRSTEITDETIPDNFRPASRLLKAQAVGPLEKKNGLMSRATTILVRYRPGAKRLAIRVRKIAESPALYPLGLKVSIPSPSGGQRIAVVIPAEGPDTVDLSVPIPSDLRPGSALDVVFEADGAAVAPGVLAPRSLYIESIDNVD